MNRLKLILILIMCGVAGFTSKATHIIGGEFELEQRTNGHYNLHLNMYFDQVNGNPGAIDQTITVAIFEKATDTKMVQLTIPLVIDSIVPYENPDCAIADLAIRLLRYTLSDFTFPGNYNHPGGYYIVYDRCCRNNVIMNINSPEATGMLFYSEFPPIYQPSGAATGYSSPVFNLVRTRYACVNEYFYIDFGATDADGDSLVFVMADPKKGVSTSNAPTVATYNSGSHTQLVNWVTGFNANDAIHGAPGLSIDPETGLLELVANQTGLHVFSIICEEYRNGVKIGETQRDFQILVDVCDPNSAPEVLMEDDSGGFYVDGDTIYIPNNGNRCFEFFVTDDDDPRNNEQISVTIVPKNFVPVQQIGLTGSGGFVGGPGDTLSGIQMCWPKCEYNQTGQPYIVDVIVADDGCILPKKDTIEVVLVVEPEVNQPPSLYLATSGKVGFYTEGDTIVIPKGTRQCFDFYVTDDADTRNSEEVKITLQPVNFVPVGDFQFTNNTGIVGGPGDTLTGLKFCWPDCEYVLGQPYQLDIIATDDDCKNPASDTITVVVLVDPNNPPSLYSQYFGKIDSVEIMLDVFVDTTIRIDFLGFDQDSADVLTLEGFPQGFSFAEAGMRFKDSSATNGYVESPFFWSPGCDQFESLGSDYTIFFVLRDNDCFFADEQDSIPVNIRLREGKREQETFIPANIFTPNGDGMNDVFSMPVLPVTNCTDRFIGIEIYNRWGRKVFGDENENFTWDGSNVPDGLYYFLAKYEKTVYKGYVTLSR